MLLFPNHCKNGNFLIDLQTYDSKSDRSFLDWITQGEKIAGLTQCQEMQLVQSKAEGIVHKLIDDMPSSSTWDAVKKRLCQVFNSMATKVHVAIQIHSRPQGANEPCKSTSKDSLML